MNTNSKRYVYCIASPMPVDYVTHGNNKITYLKFGDTNDLNERPGYSTHNPSYTLVQHDTGGSLPFSVGTYLKKEIFIKRGFTQVNDNEWAVCYNNVANCFQLLMKFKDFNLTNKVSIDLAIIEINELLPDRCINPRD